MNNAKIQKKTTEWELELVGSWVVLGFSVDMEAFG